MISSITEVEVRYSETDMMGIVYHANYLPWLELGRTNLLKENGITYSEMEESGYLLPVIEVHMNYRRPATYDDTVVVKTIMKAKAFAKIRLDYELFKKKELIATGYSIHAFMNKTGQPIKAPRPFLDAINQAFDPQ